VIAVNPVGVGLLWTLASLEVGLRMADSFWWNETGHGSYSRAFCKRGKQKLASWRSTDGYRQIGIKYRAFTRLYFDGAMRNGMAGK
jgi:hypothetical protein